MPKPLTILIVTSLLWLLPAPAWAEDKNPYKGARGSPSRPASPGRRGAIFTTEKQRPDKAERNAVFEDYRIPKNQRGNYVAEYRVPVSLGGSNAYSNIEVLPRNQARIKHQVQKQLQAMLRRKDISLEEAQFRILNWQTDPLSAPAR
jgi:hypothetical protein